MTAVLWAAASPPPRHGRGRGRSAGCGCAGTQASGQCCKMQILAPLKHSLRPEKTSLKSGGTSIAGESVELETIVLDFLLQIVDSLPWN